jgi:uncharacterized radical SAM superfamily Fe-S cluster-containing enzyme
MLSHYPELLRMVRYAYEQPIQAVMINTNGIRLAHDPALVEALAAMRDRLEIYLQFDGLQEQTYTTLRGEELLEVKRKALEALARFDLRCTLVCTVDHNTNLHAVGRVVSFGLERPIVRGVSFQLASYCGRHLDPADLERRATMPDVVKALAAQTEGLVAETDFYPLPCAHPNCHLMAYLYRGGGRPIPISQIIDVRKHIDLLANSVVYTPARARQRLKFYLIAYCCYRFATVFIRPEPVWLLGLTFYQWAALALALALAVQWWFDSNSATAELAPAPC